MGGGSKQEDVFMVVIIDDLSENRIFSKNGQSYKKNKNWTLSVHVQLNGTRTDNYQLMNKLISTAGKRMEFGNHGGGQFPWCQKIGSCLLLVFPGFG
jgi:hypothetical protein